MVTSQAISYSSVEFNKVITPLIFHLLSGMPLVFFFSLKSSPQDMFIGKERNIDVWEKHQSVPSHTCHHWGSKTQPKYMPWLGTKPATFWYMGWCSNQLSHPARIMTLCLDSHSTFLTAPLSFLCCFFLISWSFTLDCPKALSFCPLYPYSRIQDIPYILNLHMSVTISPFIFPSSTSFLKYRLISRHPPWILLDIPNLIHSKWTLGFSLPNYSSYMPSHLNKWQFHSTSCLGKNSCHDNWFCSSIFHIQFIG